MKNKSWMTTTIAIILILGMVIAFALWAMSKISTADLSVVLPLLIGLLTSIGLFLTKDANK